MDVSWAFVVLLLYPALQVPALWYVVHRYDLRNDDGPRDPRGYSVHPNREEDDRAPGECPVCGTHNDGAFDLCRVCLSEVH